MLVRFQSSVQIFTFFIIRYIYVISVRIMKKEYTKEKLEEVTLKCETLRQVLQVFNRNESASSYKVLNKRLEEWEINIKHFLTRSEVAKKLFSEGKLKKLTNSELFIKDSVCGRSSVKKRIIEDKLINYKCFKCGNEGEWMGEKIILILDHINGINNDNRIENLRFACPNCNSTLDTHCQGSKVYKIKEPKIDVRTIRHDRISSRKVLWPSKDVLIKLIENNSYCAIGRKYGVSDNAVRKWCKKYEI